MSPLPRTLSPATNARGLAALLASLSAIGPFSIDAYLPSMDEIGRVLAASPYALQMTLTAYMGPFALMTLWHGAISDALGRRQVVLWGMALFALASLGCAFAPTIGTLLVCRALQGATAGAGMVVGRAIVRDCFHGADAQRVMSQVSMTFALAPAISPVIGGWLQAWLGWRSIFAFLVLYAAVIWFLCRSILPETLPPGRRQTLHPVYLARAYGGALGSFPFMAICLASTLCFAGLFIYVAAARIFLMDQLGVSSTGFFWLFGPLTAGMALGAWLSGQFAGRMTPARTVGWGFGVMGLAATGNVLFHSLHQAGLPWSVAPMFFYSLGMSLTFPTLTLLAIDLFPEQRGLAASCQSFIQTGGAALVAMLAPMVWSTPASLATTQLTALSLAFVCMLVYRQVAKAARSPATPGPVTV